MPVRCSNAVTILSVVSGCCPLYRVSAPDVSEDSDSALPQAVSVQARAATVISAVVISGAGPRRLTLTSFLSRLGNGRTGGP